MTSSFRADSTGSYGAIQIGGEDAIRFGSDNSGQLASFRNKLINGNFGIAQRGTSQTSSGYASVDRWYNFHIGSTKTTQQGNNILSTALPDYPVNYLRTTVTSVAGAGNCVRAFQPIESVRTLAGKIATFSFWAKADSAKNIAIELYQSFGASGSAAVLGIGAQLIPLTTSWQKFSRTIQIPSIADKTIGNDGLDALGVGFWFDAGSSWNSRTAGLVQQSGVFDIALVQIEEGSIATPFEQRPIGLELSLCQRYYEIGYAAYSHGTSSTEPAWPKTQYTTFKVTKRTTATVAASSWTREAAGANIAVVSQAINMVSNNGFRFYDSDSVVDHFHLYWTASAEL